MPTTSDSPASQDHSFNLLQARITVLVSCFQSHSHSPKFLALCEAGDGAQNFMLVSQALYQLSQSSSPGFQVLKSATPLLNEALIV